MTHPPIPASAGASCADDPVPLPIDVAALSVGRPDGMYYAGRRLTPWMSFDERIELSGIDLSFMRDKRERLEELKKRRAAESIVVRWEIEDGRASIPVVLVDMHDESGTQYPRVQTPRAFLWGDVGHTDLWRLVHFLLREEIERTERTYRSSNAYTDEMRGALRRATVDDPDQWVLPASAIRTMILEKDLASARAALNALFNEAEAAGVAVGRNSDGSKVSVGVTLDRVAGVTTPELLDAHCARLVFNVGTDAAAFARHGVEGREVIRAMLGAAEDEGTFEAIQRVTGGAS